MAYKAINKYENHEVISSSCDSAYKIVNENTRNRKFCTDYRKVNHAKEGCYLKNKTQNDNQRNNPNRNIFYNNMNSFRNNSRNYKGNQSNIRDDSNFCFKGNAAIEVD